MVATATSNRSQKSRLEMGLLQKYLMTKVTVTKTVNFFVPFDFPKNHKMFVLLERNPNFDAKTCGWSFFPGIYRYLFFVPDGNGFLVRPSCESTPQVVAALPKQHVGGPRDCTVVMSLVSRIWIY